MFETLNDVIAFEPLSLLHYRCVTRLLLREIACSITYKRLILCPSEAAIRAILLDSDFMHVSILLCFHESLGIVYTQMFFTFGYSQYFQSSPFLSIFFSNTSPWLRSYNQSEDKVQFPLPFGVVWLWFERRLNDAYTPACDVHPFLTSIRQKLGLCPWIGKRHQP